MSLQTGVLLPLALLLLAGCGSRRSATDAPACSLSEPALASRLGAIDALLGAHCVAVQEEDEGYAFRFRDAPGVREAVDRLAAKERACCPFLTWRFEPPHGGTFRVHVGGSPEAKAFLEDTLPGLADASPERVGRSDEDA